MSNYSIRLIVTLFLICSCKENNKKNNILYKYIIGQPFIPSSINWQKLDSNFKEYGGLYANFRTFYFDSDSVVYMFDCQNNRKLSCLDTSVLDKTNNVYNDTVVSKYEDSILFGVENLEMYDGRYQSVRNIIICKIVKIDDGIYKRNDLSTDTIKDTLRVLRKNNAIYILYKNVEYRQGRYFKSVSIEQIHEFINLSKSKTK
jgi:hypothetical protein